MFFDTYRNFEKIFREIFKLSPSDSIPIHLKSSKYRFHYDKINYCASYRNFIAHTPPSKFNSFVVEPTDEMIRFLNEFSDILLNRKTCKDIAIPVSQIMSASHDDFVLAAMKKMKQHNYTQIPIMVDKKVIGVFRDTSLFNFIIEYGSEMFDETTRFVDLEPYINKEGNDGEVIRFYPHSLYIEELETEFKKEFDEGCRIGMVLLTQSGNDTEQLTGLITPWDLIAS